MLLHYGQEKLELLIPPGYDYEVIKPVWHEPLKNPLQEITRLLKNPIKSPPLAEAIKPGKRICIIVNDLTRLARSEIFLPPLIEELYQAGIRKENIFIVFATGSHRALTKSEMTTIVGDDVAKNIKMFNHDCYDIKNLIYMGETTYGTPVHLNRMVVEADRRIVTGTVVHHFFAGYGGGRKGLVPGVAGWETIQKNHSLMLDVNAFSGNLRGNPVHEDLLEAAQLVGADFILNTVLNEAKDIVGVFAGDMQGAHLAACELADKLYGVFLERQADFVIASCGGYPKDINLYQAHKALDNAIRAVKPGGELLLIARCPEGIGSDNFHKWVTEYQSLDEMELALRKRFELGGHKAYAIARLIKNVKVYLLSELPNELVRKIGFTPIASLKEGIDKIFRDQVKKFIYIIPQGSICPAVSANQNGGQKNEQYNPCQLK